MSGEYKNMIRGAGLFIGGFLVIGMAALMKENVRIIFYSLGTTITFMGATVIGFLMTKAQQ